MPRAANIIIWMILVAVIYALVGLLSAAGSTVTLAWDPSPDDQWVTGHRLYVGRDTRTYTHVLELGRTNQCTVDLDAPGWWYFAVTAIGTNYLESDFSNEVAYNRPLAPPTMRGDLVVAITPGGSTTTNLVDWTPFEFAPTLVEPTKAQAYFRVEGLSIKRMEVPE